jgi:flagellar protein FlbT
MALKVELKPGERIIVGGSVITNGETRTQLIIEGDEPILREKDVITPERADTPCRRVYLAVQMMYLASDVARFQERYFELVNDVVKAAPSLLPTIDAVNNWILTGNLYKALKEARALLAQEEDLLSHALRRPSV